MQADVVDDLYLAEHVAGSTLEYAQARTDTQIALANPSAVLSPTDPTGPLAARLAFIEKVRAEVTRRKRRAALLGYDDLLTELADALEADDSPARRRMRERWSVVLVDEFQDTDPVQWQVFSRAFATEDKTLVLIGDPKQAIYGFRGGDVATYLLAAQTAATRTSLPTNYRSDAPLVDALQLLMANVQLSPGIVAHPITAQKKAHRLEGAPDNSPLRLRAILGNSRLPIGTVRETVCADAAADIARLLTSGATFDGAPVRPQHIAVLAHTNRDLHLMRTALRKNGIPSVLVSNESVLRTSAAEWWLHLMMALEQPHRPDRLRLAALTPFLGWTVEQLDAGGEKGTEEISTQVRALRRGVPPRRDRRRTGCCAQPGSRCARAVAGRGRTRPDRHRALRAARAGTGARRDGSASESGCLAEAAERRRHLGHRGVADHAARLRCAGRHLVDDPWQQGPAVPDRLRAVPVRPLDEGRPDARDHPPRRAAGALLRLRRGEPTGAPVGGARGEHAPRVRRDDAGTVAGRPLVGADAEHRQLGACTGSCSGRPTPPSSSRRCSRPANGAGARARWWFPPSAWR